MQLKIKIKIKTKLARRRRDAAKIKIKRLSRTKETKAQRRSKAFYPQINADVTDYRSRSKAFYPQINTDVTDYRSRSKDWFAQSTQRHKEDQKKIFIIAAKAVGIVVLFNTA